MNNLLQTLTLSATKFLVRSWIATTGEPIVGGIAALIAWKNRDRILDWIEQSALQAQMEAEEHERRNLLISMLDAVYVETIKEKSIVVIRPKPAFMPLFEVATTRQGSDVVLVLEKELPPVDDDQKADTVPCWWWRRGRVGC